MQNHSKKTATHKALKALGFILSLFYLIPVNIIRFVFWLIFVAPLLAIWTIGYFFFWCVHKEAEYPDPVALKYFTHTDTITLTTTNPAQGTTTTTVAQQGQEPWTTIVVDVPQKKKTDKMKEQQVDDDLVVGSGDGNEPFGKGTGDDGSAAVRTPPTADDAAAAVTAGTAGAKQHGQSSATSDVFESSGDVEKQN
ncbi:unnamed protein product [Ambrosiozyma monospora]|uniref:Unnamed protein product n=1 Tax=Ambrosiozyma monospora TaxID=43982 RepID=A0ACB5TBG0_AMBMO|nr:unnamed protein product [Ambrosiozyma monospora]